MIQAARPRDLEEVAWHGEEGEAHAGDGRSGHQTEGRRTFQRRHHLRAGRPRVHVLPLGGRAEEPAAARVKRGTKKEEAEFKHTLLTTIRAAALARNQYWTAAAWLLECKYPDEYGKADRRRDEDEGGDAPRIVLGVVAQPVQERLDLSSAMGDGDDGAGGGPGEGGAPSRPRDDGTRKEGDE